MFVKLFAKILDSSIWMESNHTKVVWITLLAASDRTGIAIFASVKNLARRAGVTLAEAEEAIHVLESPDADSGDPENEGRRIERVPGGWAILNHGKYRKVANADQERNLAAERARRYRHAKRHAASRCVTDSNGPVTPTVTVESPSPSLPPTPPFPSPPAEADAEREAARARSRAVTEEGESGAENPQRIRSLEAIRPTWKELKAKAEMIGLPEWRAREWFEEMESVGWVDGKGREIVNAWNYLNRVMDWWKQDGCKIKRDSGTQGVSPSVKALLAKDELKRVDESLRKLDASCDSHIDLSAKDLERRKKLLKRRSELKAALGFEV